MPELDEPDAEPRDPLDPVEPMLVRDGLPEPMRDEPELEAPLLSDSSLPLVMPSVHSPIWSLRLLS